MVNVTASLLHVFYLLKEYTDRPRTTRDTAKGILNNLTGFGCANSPDSPVIAYTLHVQTVGSRAGSIANCLRTSIWRTDPVSLNISTKLNLVSLDEITKRILHRFVQKHRIISEDNFQTPLGIFKQFVVQINDRKSFTSLG